MKKIVVVILVMILGLTIWYLLIKKYDYEITFKANFAPQGVYHQVKKIGSGLHNAKKDHIINTSNLTQEVSINNEKVILDWHFKRIQDTITKIRVGILSKEHSIRNRLQVLVGSSAMVQLVKEDLINFRKKLKGYTNTFKVIVEGETDIPAMETLSVSSKITRKRKAEEMMTHNSYLYPKLVERNVRKSGFPYVKIKNWNQEEDVIDLDFGFPIVYNDSLPVDSKINHTKIASKKALKATYYGNYRTSDEAWFVLLEHATANNISVEIKPLEIFYNDPMHGGNELEWKAEVFLPIIEH
ncbi:hypothetical protein [Aquimarina sp. 2304DJ70-9]|uniref:hypothetical protein n=1 Tax=Aquimarina penaris TaxID=3231044 RepID=UPI0034629697